MGVPGESAWHAPSGPSRVMNSTVGIRLEGTGLRVDGNLVSNCAGGLEIAARNSVVENNVLSANGTGLSFVAIAKDNVYRGNTSRGNGTDFADQGDGNTSGGDNYLPDRR